MFSTLRRRSALSAALMGIALAGATSSPTIARADECVLPVCAIPAAMNDFRAMSAERRLVYLTDILAFSYAENEDVASAKNLIDVAKQAAEIVRTSPQAQPEVAAAAAALMEQSYEQVAKFAPLSTDDLMTSFRALTTSSARFRIINYWGPKLANITNIVFVQKLRTFFMGAVQVTTAAGDEDFIKAAAISYEAAANNRIVDLNPAAPSVVVPITDMPKAVDAFRGMLRAERYLLLKSLVEAYKDTANNVALMSLVEFSKQVATILNQSPETQAASIAANQTLLAQSLDQLSRSNNLTNDEMASVYRQLTGGVASRYAMLNFWRGKVDSLTDVVFLRKLVGFFQKARAASVSISDEQYVLDAAFGFEQATEQRIAEVDRAPAFPLPVPNVQQAADTFRGWPLSTRVMIVRKLVNDTRGNANAPVLLSVNQFAKAVDPILRSSGDTQKFLVDENDALIASTTEQLVRNPALSAADLLKFYKELRGSAARYDSLTYWSAQVDTITNKPLLQTLEVFFRTAKTHSFTTGDDQFIIRFAGEAEKKAREKYRSMP